MGKRLRHAFEPDEFPEAADKALEVAGSWLTAAVHRRCTASQSEVLGQFASTFTSNFTRSTFTSNFTIAYGLTSLLL